MGFVLSLLWQRAKQMRQARPRVQCSALWHPPWHPTMAPTLGTPVWRGAPAAEGPRPIREAM